jgi:lipopolysaccharide/colanic/teichoic acid biosynthesis glycosyltransferase
MDFVKRVMDVSVAAVALLVLSPVAAAAALLIRLEDRGPMFYRQERVGKDGRLFQLLKLRSMRVNQLTVAQVGPVGAAHPLVTRTGRIIRRLKIDEIPQLINVLRGDMSLVGPRPTIQEQVLRYDEFQRRRLAVKPGMTGWAQVNGGVEYPWPERIMLDVWYVEHRSLALDLQILVRTVGVVVRGERPSARALQSAKAYANSIGWCGR